jgi:RND family efflux transporter MFP subunit
MKLNIKIAFILILTGYLFAGCNSETQNNGPQSSIVTPSVEAIQARFGGLPLEERLSGVVRARNQVEIYSRISAPVEEVLVQNGEYVTQGQPLVKLRDNEYNERVRQSEANLRINEARAKQAEAALNELQSRLRRQLILAEQNMSSELELEALKAQVQSAEANYELSLAQVEQAESSLNEQRELLSQTIVKSPISGTVGQRNAEIGMQVNTGTRLFTVGDLRESKVMVNLTERMLNYIKTGQTARIYSDNMGDSVITSNVSRISPFLSAGSFSTEAEIDVSEEQGSLLPGMFVTVDILYGESDQATIVPLAAIYNHPRSGEQGIYVAPNFGIETEPIMQVDAANPPPLSEPTEFEFVPVEVVARGREAAGVTGIQPGQWIVTVGQSMLVGHQQNTMRVRAVEWDRIIGMQRTRPQDLLRDVMESDMVENRTQQN